MTPYYGVIVLMMWIRVINTDYVQCIPSLTGLSQFLLSITETWVVILSANFTCTSELCQCCYEVIGSYKYHVYISVVVG